MGFLSKAWKGIKGAFKSIGRGVKKVAGSIGKFMDKIGVVGQIALMFVLPGIGGALAKGFTSGAALLAGSGNTIIAGVGKVLQTAGKFASSIGNAYKTVTDGVFNFVKKVGGSAINSVASALGKEGALISSAPTNFSQGFNDWMKGVADDVQNIPSPFRTAATSVENEVANNYTKSLGLGDEDSFKIGKPFEDAQEDFRFYDVPKEQYGKILTQERTGFNKLVTDVGKYTLDVAKDLPNKVVDTVASTVTQGVGNKAAQAVGLDTTPEYNVQNVTNVIPAFNSTPIQRTYESSGINYGATPESRVQYFAATSPYGDYGTSAFSTFSSLRPA